MPLRGARDVTQRLFIILVAGAALLPAARVIPGAPSHQPRVGQAGSVSVQVAPARVVAGASTALAFTFKAGGGGLRDGVLVLSVPAGWARPSLSAASAGRVRTSTGALAVRGAAIEVRGVALAPGSRLTIAYGGGPSGATEPTGVASYAFRVSVAASSAAAPAPLARSPSVEVRAPAFRCATTRHPRGIGRRLSLANGIAQANLYNTRSAAGVIKQCYGAAGLTTNVALTGISTVGPGPAGYPEAAYGYHLYDRPFCAMCNSQPFPLPVAGLGDLEHDYRLTVAYSLGAPSPRSLPRDFVYDLWLEHHPSPGSAPHAGDVELIVFLYHRQLSENCLTSPPPGAFSTDAYFNGRYVSSTWRVCRIDGGTDATPVAYFLEDPPQSRSGEISLPLTRFVAEAGNFLGRSLDGYSLMGIELGGEFDQCYRLSGCAAGRVSWQWRISRLVLQSASAAIPIVFTATSARR
jgi:hypothetical protein